MEKKLRINVEQIPAAGMLVTEALPQAFVAELLQEPNQPLTWDAVEGGSINLELKPEDNCIRMRGQGLFSLKHPCVRCLQEVSHAAKISFDLRLIDSKKLDVDESESFADLFEDDADNDGVMEEESLAVAAYHNRRIDLARLVREQLFLELPLYPACQNACGFETVLQKQNDEKPVDPRFAKLIELKKAIDN